MSERKEEEELIEHGSSSESSESEQMVDAEVELEESPQHEEEHDNPSGNSDSQPSDEGDKNVESAEEVQMNGDISSPHKSTTVDGTSSADDLRGEDDHVCSVDGTKRESELVVNENNASFVQPEVVLAKGDLETKGGENVKELNDFVESKSMEELRNVKESNCVEESKNVEESKSLVELKDVGKMMDVEELKDVKEPRDTEEVKKEVNAMAGNPVPELNGVRDENLVKRESAMVLHLNTEMSNQSFPSQLHMADGDDGTDEEQAAFVKELESFFRERGMEFKHPKFYGEGLNCLKLWRAVTKLGGYDRVTACKLWRQVGESFKPPKTCTTVSWSFRIFYEKALLDYERHKMRGGELMIPASPLPEPMSIENHMGGHQGSGRARRDAAARAMQGWHSQRLLGNGEVGDPIIKDKNSLSTPKREKHLKSVGLLKRKKPSILDRSVKAARTITKVTKPQIDTDVADIGTPAADWVKINVLRTKDCFEVYALVPGLLREEVRVQSDPAGRLVISGDPEQPDNPWGVTPFKKVITLPSRIDPHQTSAVVTLHGQLFVRVPFEQSDL